MASGYTPCACRDCFDIAISDNVEIPELCWACEEAECEPNNGECCRTDQDEDFYADN